MTDAKTLNHLSLGAPDIRTTTGIVDVLRYCLVTNPHPDGAWTEPFTPAPDVTVFKNHISGGEFCINVNNGGGGGAYAEITCYRNMTAIEVGTDQFGPAPGYMNGRDTNAVTDPGEWFCYYNQKFFILVCHYGTGTANNYDQSFLAFGPGIKPLSSNDVNNCFILVNDASSGFSYTYDMWRNAYANSGAWVSNLDGTVNNPGLYLNYYTGGTWPYGIYDSPIHGTVDQTAVSNIVLKDANTTGDYRALFPGVLICMTPPGGHVFAEQEVLVDSGDLSGADETRAFFAYNSGQLLISTHEGLWS